MPELDGVATVREMRRTGYTMPIIMFSTLTDRGATATLDALSAGATDYVTKPANVGSVGRSMEQVRDLAHPQDQGPGPPSRRRRTGAHRSPQRPRTAERRPGGPPFRRPGTGPAGPALVPGRRLPHPRGRQLHRRARRADPLPDRAAPAARPDGDRAAHAALFTRQFAARLDRQLASPVTEAVTGQRLEPGSVTIAPGDFHLHLTGTKASLVARLSQEAPENYCRPAVDVLFRTAAQVVRRSGARPRPHRHGHRTAVAGPGPSSRPGAA